MGTGLGFLINCLLLLGQEVGICHFTTLQRSLDRASTLASLSAALMQANDLAFLAEEAEDCPGARAALAFETSSAGSTLTLP